MNRRALLAHLRSHGCELLRHGARHDMWWNPANGNKAAVPRHRTIKKPTVRSICRDLGVPPPDGR